MAVNLSLGAGSPPTGAINVAGQSFPVSGRPVTLAQFISRLNQSAATIATNFRRTADVFGQELETHAKAKLGTYQGEAGIFPAWAPLAAATIEDKLSQGFPTPSPLLREGDMQRSIGHLVEQKTGTEIVVTLFTTSEYAPYQELGTKDMSPRPFIGSTAWELSAKMMAGAAHNVTLTFLDPGASFSAYGSSVGAGGRVI